MATRKSATPTLRDGRWYSIIGRYPRMHHHAKWVAGQQRFVWQGTSEDKTLELDEVDEVLGEVGGPDETGWATT